MENIIGTFVGLNTIAVLFGLRLGSFVVFCHEWDSADRIHNNSYIQQRWSKRESLIPGQKSVVNIPGQKNVVNIPLIDPEKFIYLRCTSNLDSVNVVKQWIKIALYLKYKFRRTSDDK